MELRHLRYFVAVAEELNFRRAAERLSMAQPPLSQQIHDLEKDLGVQLFDRSNRTVQLTVAGRVFLTEAYDILARSERAVRRAQRANRGELGQLTLGYTSLTYNPLFPQILRLHRMRYPEVELILRDLVTIEQMQQLNTNMLDVSFATHASFAITSLEQETLAQEPILHEPMVALLSANHKLARQPNITLADLAHEAWIWFARPFDPTTYDYMMRLFEQVGFHPNVTQEINQQHIILSLVSAGFGVSLAPKSTANLGSYVDVVFLDVVDPTPIVEFNIIWRRNDPSPILQRFLATVREVVQNGKHK
ncbi:LysR family transcriptional regulator [Dictyobacter alpinus]|uniref:LysR family transcriptional regulator n=1 Tax=Dictyobacter alpinus TaxID=2014873 RepID=A0A402BCC9_9CHLR|nr:LysR substrate-binding domain-containing protein [Dictyobacter alpinus]GCE28942.1 LysR family transcriptional regulator [Dictyobacter alpinus]